ncbi:hypothetical protein [Virgibacillus sp. DJP39]|uniref:hypothetical protein n=1 Tax=Virgibacillus sp. DJP39 TaxID=3409790 RepID=UPI003BB6584D
MKKYLYLIVLLFLAACQSEDQVIVKKETNQQNINDNPELVEKSTSDEEVDEMIEFILPEEKVMINLGMVPILDSYLSASQDRKKSVESMVLTPIHIDNSHLYLLEFSCIVNSCSYLLLDKSEENQAHLVADLANLKGIKTSPDNTKLLLWFDRKSSSPVPLSNIVGIDTTDWKLLTYTTPGERKILNYNLPILSAQWNDNDTISISIPSIDDTSPSILSKWKAAGKPTTETTLTLN